MCGGGCGEIALPRTGAQKSWDAGLGITYREQCSIGSISNVTLQREGAFLDQMLPGGGLALGARE